MQTAEKLRREKWIKDKSQQIKELTVKGLEPDIQKLIAKHKAEIKKLKSSHQVSHCKLILRWNFAPVHVMKTP